jgi:hypothetical protein
MPSSTPELRTDPNNANAGTAHGRGMVERSLQRYGAGHSIVVDKHGTAIAGNTALEGARELGIPVEVIPSDGTTLYAIQRTDLDLSSDVAAMDVTPYV